MGGIGEVLFGSGQAGMFGCGGTVNGASDQGGEVAEVKIEEVKGEGRGEIPFLDAVYDYFDIKKVDVPEAEDNFQPVECVDSDLDGYGVGADCPAQDCDDTKPGIHPGAEEICDGIDNDCDGDRNCLPQIPDTCVGDEAYGPCSCFVESKTLEEEGAIDMDPFAILNNIHDGDTFSDYNTIYRICAADTAEVEGSDGYHCWLDQWGIGEYAQGGPLATNFGQLDKEYLENALMIAIQEGYKVQGVLSKKDQYGRQLVYLFINEQSFPCRALREGLAWETVNFYGLGSHPILADMALKASEMYGEQNLKFLEPYKYKDQAPKCQN